MQYWCSHSVIFNLYQIVKIYGNWKISAFYCCIRLVISLALPLSLLPFTFGTRIVFLQWNVSQCFQIWIFNISNTDLFTQTIYLWYKYYSKWICVTFSFQYIKYTWAPQPVHNTPVMNILKGYLYITLFYKKRIKETKVKFQISAKFVNACRRKEQKMDGRTESQTDTEWWHWNLIYSILNKAIWNISAQYFKKCKRKVR